MSRPIVYFDHKQLGEIAISGEEFPRLNKESPYFKGENGDGIMYAGSFENCSCGQKSMFLFIHEKNRAFRCYECQTKWTGEFMMLEEEKQYENETFVIMKAEDDSIYLMSYYELYTSDCLNEDDSFTHYDIKFFLPPDFEMV
jgi:hypothetical protein